LTQAGSLIEEAAKSGDTAELREQLAHLAVYLSQIEILPG
jgi:hypothetical protein